MSDIMLPLSYAEALMVQAVLDGTTFMSRNAVVASEKLRVKIDEYEDVKKLEALGHQLLLTAGGYFCRKCSWKLMGTWRPKEDAHRSHAAFARSRGESF